MKFIKRNIQRFSSKGLDVCEDIDQFDRYENYTLPLVTRGKKYIEKTTGCLYPCTYHEYKVSFLCNGFGIGEDLYLNFVILQIVDKREFRDVTYQDYVGFLIYFGSVAVTVKEEVCPIFPLKHKIIKI